MAVKFVSQGILKNIEVNDLHFTLKVNDLNSFLKMFSLHFINYLMGTEMLLLSCG